MFISINDNTHRYFRYELTGFWSAPLIDVRVLCQKRHHISLLITGNYIGIVGYVLFVVEITLPARIGISAKSAS
jgi:hypothetical protein